MRAVDVAPVVEHRDDLGFFGQGESTHRIPARRCVIERHAVGNPAAPSFQPALRQLKVAARAASGPPGGLGVSDQVEQCCIGRRWNPAWEPATQPQGSLPSARVSRTAISANAVRRRSTSACAASSS